MQPVLLISKTRCCLCAISRRCHALPKSNSWGRSVYFLLYLYPAGISSLTPSSLSRVLNLDKV